MLMLLMRHPSMPDRTITPLKPCTRARSLLPCAIAAALLLALPTAMARTPKAKSPAKAQAPALTVYKGRFASECDMMADGLYTQDIVDMRPIGPDKVEASYHKALYTQVDCAPGARLGTLHLPVATWQLDSPFKIGKSTAHRISMVMPEGPITATVDQIGKLKETDQSWVMTIGQEQVPIDKTSPAVQEKDLRLLEGDVLYFGDPGSPDAQNYPQEPLRNHPMKRISAKP
jgi:hypothetical protein